jgi:hypothetical protein
VIRPIYAMESYIRRKPVLGGKEENCLLQGTSAYNVERKEVNVGAYEAGAITFNDAIVPLSRR